MATSHRPVAQRKDKQLEIAAGFCKVFTQTLNINGQVFPAGKAEIVCILRHASNALGQLQSCKEGSAARGTIEVTYVNGAKKAVPPEHLGTFVRKFLWLNLTTQSDACSKHVRQVAVCNSAEFQNL